MNWADLKDVVETFTQPVVALGVIVTIWQAVAAKRKAEIAADHAANAAAAITEVGVVAEKAEAAATHAASTALRAVAHSVEAVEAIAAVSENVQRVEEATNGMREALVEAEGLAGEQRGREQAKQEMEDKKAE